MPETTFSSHDPIIGCWLQTPSPWVCEILAAIGFDALFVDGEHGTLTHQTIDPVVALAKALGLKVFYRVATADRPYVQQALDSGADALILPQIRDLGHAREAAAFAKYPPLGSRGMGTPRSLNYGETPIDFVLQENRRTKCFVMIETVDAFKHVKEIAALPTVDGLFMGPYDLSLTRGRGQYGATAADSSDAVAIAEAASSANKLLGMPIFTKDDLSLAKRHRAHVVTIADEISVLVEGLRTKLEEFSAAMAQGTR
jgi:2-dehydro-3-deoxyglucarate aldolase